MNNQPRVYTYKITFEETPHYYYGSKKEKYFGQEYFGSPVTHKWYWEFYTPKKQILELFDYDDIGYDECRKVENRLIKPHLNDPYCLNENCGGNYSLKIKRQIGINHFTAKVGIHTQTIECRIEMGKKLWYNKKGIHSLTEEQRKYNASLGGSTGAGGRVVGKKMFKEKCGIFALTKNNLSENGKKGSKNTNSQKWKCTITGYISTSGGLSRYQKARKIDTTNRIKLNV
jgi:hypothetical protein